MTMTKQVFAVSLLLLQLVCQLLPPGVAATEAAEAQAEVEEVTFDSWVEEDSEGNSNSGLRGTRQLQGKDGKGGGGGGGKDGKGGGGGFAGCTACNPDASSASDAMGVFGADDPFWNPNGIMERKPCIPFDMVIQSAITSPNADAQCATNDCSGGCCRYYHWLKCDVDNEFPYDPCVCNAETWPTESHPAYVAPVAQPTPPPVTLPPTLAPVAPIPPPVAAAPVGAAPVAAPVPFSAPVPFAPTAATPSVFAPIAPVPFAPIAPVPFAPTAATPSVFAPIAPVPFAPIAPVPFAPTAAAPTVFAPIAPVPFAPIAPVPFLPTAAAPSVFAPIAPVPFAPIAPVPFAPIAPFAFGPVAPSPIFAPVPIAGAATDAAAPVPVGAAPVAAPVAAGAGAGTPATPATADIVDTAAGNPDLSTLVQAVTEAGLVDTLKGTGPFTVFAPQNSAFPTGVALEELLSDPAALTEILLYHVVPGDLLSADLTDGQVLTTQEGGTLTIGLPAGGTPTVNGVNIIAPDVLATNGVIHVIDGILTPPAVQKIATDGTAP